jgi:hypothetical protein
VLGLILFVGPLWAEETQKKVTGSAEQSEKVARVLEEIMGAPDKAILQGVLDKAECVSLCFLPS